MHAVLCELLFQQSTEFPQDDQAKDEVSREGRRRKYTSHGRRHHGRPTGYIGWPTSDTGCQSLHSHWSFGQCHCGEGHDPRVWRRLRMRQQDSLWRCDTRTIRCTSASRAVARSKTRQDGRGGPGTAHELPEVVDAGQALAHGGAFDAPTVMCDFLQFRRCNARTGGNAARFPMQWSMHPRKRFHQVSEVRDGLCRLSCPAHKTTVFFHYDQCPILAAHIRIVSRSLLMYNLLLQCRVVVISFVLWALGVHDAFVYALEPAPPPPV